MRTVKHKRKGCNKTAKLEKPLKEKGKANNVWPAIRYIDRELLVKRTVPMAVKWRSESWKK
jgi:hypothetical protein